MDIDVGVYGIILSLLCNPCLTIYFSIQASCTKQPYLAHSRVSTCDPYVQVYHAQGFFDTLILDNISQILKADLHFIKIKRLFLTKTIQ